MKKIDLENKVNELSDYIIKQSEQHKKEMVELTNKYNQFIKEKEDNEYQNWKKTNEKFLNRFIEETLSERLSIKLNSSYGGFIEVDLKYNNLIISSDNEMINIERNGLEE